MSVVIISFSQYKVLVIYLFFCRGGSSSEDLSYPDKVKITQSPDGHTCRGAGVRSPPAPARLDRNTFLSFRRATVHALCHETVTMLERRGPPSENASSVMEMH